MEITHLNKDQRRLDQRRTGRTSSPTGTSFEAALKETAALPQATGVDEAMNDLREQERRFLDAQSIAELMKYKQLLQKVLSMIMADSFESSTIPRRRRDKADFFIVRQINEKVDQLTKLVASRDNRAFELMSTIEEIRGLLCDLTH